jgi:TDG/mug DNA glycosylase family protein
MRFTRAELEAFRGREVDDLVGPGLRLLFVGINPGLWTAAVRTHFAHPTNRFYPALAAAGITDYEVDRVAGMTDADRAHLVARGVGITNLVRRATSRASELSRGLNAHETVATLAAAYAAPAAEAGVITR